MVERMNVRRPRACSTSASRSRRSLALVLALVTLVSFAMVRSASARDVYVEPPPNGKATNDGSKDRPVDLATALSGRLTQPGDTIWLRNGTYVGTFVSSLNGTSALPITVRQYPGERATLDARSPVADTLDINGSYTIFWGFEVMNSDPTRFGTDRGATVNVFGAGTKLINMVVHDGGAQGVGFWTPVVGGEMYGLIVSNNGYDLSDRGHGHSLYTQNQSGVKLISDNIMFNSYSFGIHAYTQGGQIDNFDFEGNILFNHGMLSRVSGAKSDMLLGGSQVARNAVVKNNYTYYPQGVGGRGADLGYGTACENIDVQGNYFVGDTALNFNCSVRAFLNNQLYGGGTSALSSAFPFPSNTYYSARPTGVQIYLRPNKYETGRANIAIYNWALQPQVSVDLSLSKLTPGQPFEIRDAQNFYGPAVVTGIYNGSLVSIPMTGLTSAAVFANPPFVPAHTGTEFGAYVVLPGLTPAGLGATFSASPASMKAGQSSTLSWTTNLATSVSISGIGAVAANGTRSVSPSATTTYTLVATDAAGVSISRQTTVTIVPNVAPQVTLGTANNQTTFEAPASIALTATATDSDGTINGGVRFYNGNNPTLIGSKASPPYTFTWSGVAAGTYSLTAAATDNDGVTTTSAPVVVTVRTPPPSLPGQALFLKTDQMTSGTWKGTYGAQGYSLANDGTNLPAYALMTVANGIPFTWASSTTDPRGLQKAASSTDRLAAVWYNNSPFTFDVNLIDGNAHNVALYLLDWDNGGRAESIAIIDANTGAVLDTRAASSFRNGQYLVWRLSGHVIIKVTWTGGFNAVVGGLFFDQVTASPAGAQAAYVKTDLTTGGAWKGTYGADGYSIANDSTSLPSYAQLTLANQLPFTWAPSTTDARALQKAASATDRLAACWHQVGPFTLDMNLTGGAHDVALYLLDWDNGGRAETITVTDAATGALLDTRFVSSFRDGQYIVWRVTGHVTFKITWTGGFNGVVSGVFFGAGAGSPPVVPPPSTVSASFVRTDVTTGGTWKGVYGIDGYSVANDGASMPSYAQLTFAGHLPFTWAASTTDTRALQKVGSANDRLAACWYNNSPFTLDVNLTDGLAHNVALYVMDWDNGNRAETITVTDAATGAVLDTRSVSSFRGGQYLVWRVTGRVIFKVTWTGGFNAVVGGVFFN